MIESLTFLEIPFRLALLAMLFFLGGCLSLIWLLVRGVRRKRRYHLENKRFRPKITRTALGSLTSLVLLTTSAALFNLALFIRTYSVFTGRTLIARVETSPSTDPAYDFNLAFTPVGKGHETSQTYPIKGDQWTVEGNVLLWSPEVSLLGLRPGYKLTRIRGRYLDEGHEITQDPTVHALADETRDQMWLKLLQLGEVEPYVDAIYGSAVTQFPKGSYGIYVTSSGLLVEPIEDPL